MKLLFFGDVVGEAGTDCFSALAPGLRREYGADLLIVNGENSAPGSCLGITKQSADRLFSAGADVITTGNHCYSRGCESLFEHPRILRPANYPEGAPGKGVCTVDCGRFSLTVINLMGTAFMEPLDNPFSVMEQLLPAAESKCIFVDFHAEATAEKRAMGWFLAGKVSAVIGTHTHVQTADEEILGDATGYLTDAGMVGPANSVLGIRPEDAVRKQRFHIPVRFSEAPPPCILNAVFLEMDAISGKCTKIERIFMRHPTK